MLAGFYRRFFGCRKSDWLRQGPAELILQPRPNPQLLPRTVRSKSDVVCGLKGRSVRVAESLENAVDLESPPF